jgi:hypothetical protein
MLRRIGIIAVLSLIIAAVAAVPALGVPATSTDSTGGLKFKGTPQVTATKTADGAFLTATGEVSGAGTTATATLAADAAVTTGCINRGSQDQQPSGLRRTNVETSGQQTFNTRSGRGTFTVSTVPITSAGADCPPPMRPTLVSVNFTDITLTVTSQTGTATATFADIDP